MASNNLTGTSPSATLNQLLHIGVGTLSAGCPVRLGDGSATCLTLATTGITVAGNITASGAISTGSLVATGTLTTAGDLVATGTLSTAGLVIGRLGTVARSVKISDSSGALHPTLRAVVTAGASNSTTTLAALTLAWENGSALLAGTYQVRGKFLCRCATVGTGTRLQINGPSAQTTVFNGNWFLEGAPAKRITAWAVLYDTTTAPVAAAPYLQTFEGFLVLSADSATPPTIQLASGAATYSAEVLAGSFLEFERLA